MACNIIATQGVPPTPPPPILNTELSNLVETSIDDAHGFARSAFEQATATLTDLGSALNALTDPTIDVAPFNPSAISAIDTSGLPVAPLLDAVFPSAPGEPQTEAVTLPSVGDAPVFTASAPAVDLDITPPSELSATLPVSPDVDTVTIPTAPSLDLPAVPSLFGIDIPAAPTLNLPTFDAQLGDSPLAPDANFSFTETTYSDDLLDLLRTRLYEMVDGMHTGIPVAVEQAIWQRGRDREAALMRAGLDDIRRIQAARGFTQPPGAASLLALAVIQKAQDAAATLNREVMIKQAELEQQNRQFAISSAMQLEGALLVYANQQAQRAFEAARYGVEALIAVFQAKVAKYNADVQAYAVQAQVFKSLLEAELAKLEIYKAQLDGQRLIGEINVQLVNVYKTRVDAARTVIDLFRAQVEAARAQIDAGKSEIEVFGARVQAFEATVRAKAVEYDGYASRIKAEVSKLEAFRTYADAYRSQVEGYSAGIQAKTALSALDVKIKQEVPLDAYKARIQAYQGQVAAVAEQIKAVADVFDAEVRAYAAGIQGQSAQVGAEAEVVKAEASAYSASANAEIEAARLSTQTLIEQVRLRVEAIRGSAQVSAQLAAGAMAGISISAGVHSSASESVSQSTGVSTSSSFGVSFSKSCSDVTTHKGQDE